MRALHQRNRKLENNIFRFVDVTVEKNDLYFYRTTEVVNNATTTMSEDTSSEPEAEGGAALVKIIPVLLTVATSFVLFM